MKLSELKSAVAAHLGAAEADLTVGSQDLFLFAANNARRKAELSHNFEMSRVTASLTIAGASGGALNTATILGNDPAVFSGIKEITAVARVRSGGAYLPVDFTRADIAVERERTELEYSSDLWPNERYPSDAQILSRGSSATITQQGGKLYVYPINSESTVNVEVQVIGFGWLLPYTAAVLSTENPDFIVEYGHEYLFWSILIELNHKFKVFVARTEGNLPPPTELRDRAWRDLFLWDSYLVDSNLTRSR